MTLPPNATVSISPKRAAVVAVRQPQQFTATVTGSVSNLSVTWSVDGSVNGSPAVGTISSSGLYTPPAEAGIHTITATSVALSSASGTASMPGVFTYHNDLARDGANEQEYALTSSNVNIATFGKLFPVRWTAQPTLSRSGCRA